MLKYFLCFFLFLFAASQLDAQCDPTVFQGLEIRSVKVGTVDYTFGDDEAYEISGIVNLRYSGPGNYESFACLVTSDGDTILRTDLSTSFLQNGRNEEISLPDISRDTWMSHYHSESGNATLVIRVTETNNPSNSRTAKKTLLLHLPPRPSPVSAVLKKLEPGEISTYRGSNSIEPKLSLFFTSNEAGEHLYRANIKLVSESGQTILDEQLLSVYLRHNQINIIELPYIDYGKFSSAVHRSDRFISCYLDLSWKQDKPLSVKAQLPVIFPDVPLPLSAMLERIQIDYDASSAAGITLGMGVRYRLSFAGSEREANMCVKAEICNMRGDTILVIDRQDTYPDNARFTPANDFEYISVMGLSYQQLASGISPRGDSCRFVFHFFHGVEPGTVLTVQKKVFVRLPQLPAKLSRCEAMQIIPDHYSPDGSRGIALLTDPAKATRLNQLIDTLNNFDIRTVHLCFLLKSAYAPAVSASTDFETGGFTENSPLCLHIPFAAMQQEQGVHEADAYYALTDFFGMPISDTFFIGRIHYTVPPSYLVNARLSWLQEPFAEECGHDLHYFRVFCGTRTDEIKSTYSRQSFVNKSQDFELHVYQNERLDMGVSDEHTRRFLLFFKSRYDHFHFYDSIHPDFSKAEQDFEFTARKQKMVRVHLQITPAEKDRSFKAHVDHNVELSGQLGFLITAEGILPRQDNNDAYTVTLDDAHQRLAWKKLKHGKDSSVSAHLFVPYSACSQSSDTLLIRISNTDQDSVVVYSSPLIIPGIAALLHAQPEFKVNMKDTVLNGLSGKVIRYTLKTPAGIISPGIKTETGLYRAGKKSGDDMSIIDQYADETNGWKTEHAAFFCAASHGLNGDVSLKVSISKNSDTLFRKEEIIPLSTNNFRNVRLTAEGPKRKRKWKNMYSPYDRFLLVYGSTTLYLELHNLSYNHTLAALVKAAPGDSIFVYHVGTGSPGYGESTRTLAWKGTCGESSSISFHSGNHRYEAFYEKLRLKIVTE